MLKSGSSPKFDAQEAIVLAHDMKSSVSIIGGFVLRLLQRTDEVDTERAKKYLGIVKDEAEKLELLINEFLECSRLRLGKLKLNFDVTSLDKMLLELCQAYEPDANRLGIAIHPQNEEGLPLIDADSRQLRRVFTNSAGQRHQVFRSREEHYRLGPAGRQGNPNRNKG